MSSYQNPRRLPAARHRRLMRHQGELLNEATAVGAAVCRALCMAMAGRVAASHGSPRLTHIMSLKICTDELLMDLAPPRRIASVTFLAREKAVAETVAAGGTHSRQSQHGGRSAGGASRSGADRHLHRRRRCAPLLAEKRREAGGSAGGGEFRRRSAPSRAQVAEGGGRRRRAARR